MKPDLDGGGFTQLLSVTLGKIGSGFGYLERMPLWNNLYQHIIIIGEGTSKSAVLNQHFSHDSNNDSV
jgi:hypothetical protein